MSESLFCSQKTIDFLEKPKSEIPTLYFRFTAPWSLIFIIWRIQYRYRLLSVSRWCIRVDLFWVLSKSMLFVHFSTKKLKINKILSLGFKTKIWTFKGSSHWFLNQNKKMVVPHIVPIGTANNMILHKIRKKLKRAKSTHPTVWCMEHWIYSRDMNVLLCWTAWVGFPHNSGLPRFSAFCCHHHLRPDTAPCCKFRPLTSTLANHKGVMPDSIRTIVCTPVSPRWASNSSPHHWHYSQTSQH